MERYGVLCLFVTRTIRSPASTALCRAAAPRAATAPMTAAPPTESTSMPSPLASRSMVTWWGGVRWMGMR
eukprot:scaffold24470_cov60-Phaeocystis_antarctica.AAC.1